MGMINVFNCRSCLSAGCISYTVAVAVAFPAAFIHTEKKIVVKSTNSVG